MKLFESFAGIGSQFKALKNIQQEMNWEIESVGIVEWFIPAIIGYQVIHYDIPPVEKQVFNSNISISSDSKKPLSKESFKRMTNNTEIGFYLNQSKDVAHNLFDISKVKGKDLPKDIDIFTYSFPCQDISNQGKQKGFEKGSKTRSGLLWEVERILTEIYNENPKHLPNYLLLENVKAIINDKNINTFNSWLERLEELGYESKWYCLNAANYGSSQNRERVFAISIRKDHKKKTGFTFPEFNMQIEDKKPIKDIGLENAKYESKWNQYSLSNASKLTKNNIKKFKLENYSNFQSESYVYDINYSGPTLTASGAMSRIKLFYGNKKIRTMLPCECFRYMGFTTEDWMKVNDTNLIPETKQIYLCGNSISVEMLEAIFKEFKF